MNDLKYHLFGSSGVLSSSIRKIVKKDCSDLVTYGTSNLANIYCDIRDVATWPTKLRDGIVIINAWIMSPRDELTMSKNLDFCSRISDLAKKSNIPLIFISSMSASRNAKSLYGKFKFSAENYVMRNSQTIIRPGLVISRDDESDPRVVGTVSRYTEIARWLFRFVEFQNQLRIPVVDLKTFESDLSKILRESPQARKLNSVSHYLSLTEIVSPHTKKALLNIRISDAHLLNLTTRIAYVNESKFGNGNITDRLLSLLDSCNFYDSIQAKKTINDS